MAGALFLKSLFLLNSIRPPGRKNNPSKPAALMETTSSEKVKLYEKTQDSERLGF